MKVYTLLLTFLTAQKQMSSQRYRRLPDDAAPKRMEAKNEVTVGVPNPSIGYCEAGSQIRQTTCNRSVWTQAGC